MTEAADRLGRQVRMRLAQLGITARTLSRFGYTQPGQLERLIRGESVPKVLNGLDRGLGWLEGSAYQVSQGGTATPLLQPANHPGSSYTPIYWPRPDKDWRAACEDAWQRWEETYERDIDASIAADLQQVASAKMSWQRRLDEHTRDWPVWLADRTKRILTDPGSSRQDPLELAEHILGLRHYKSLVRLLYEHRDELEASRAAGIEPPG